MFSYAQKREISGMIQNHLQGLNHPKLPKGEIQFHLHVDGAESWSFADIKNNNAVNGVVKNQFNEMQAQKQG